MGSQTGDITPAPSPITIFPNNDPAKRDGNTEGTIIAWEKLGRGGKGGEKPFIMFMREGNIHICKAGRRR